MSESYDCTTDVMEHRRKVEDWLKNFAEVLCLRAKVHDDSKLKSPEKECFDQWTPELKRRKFGSDEYKQALSEMGIGLKHHYEANRHHPEHYENGIDGMTLHDLIEMFCDWLAASEARNTHVDMDALSERFNISPQLKSIFINTLKDEDYWNEITGVPVGYFTPPGQG